MTTDVLARGAGIDGATTYDAIVERGGTSDTEIEAGIDHESVAVFQISGGTTGLREGRTSAARGARVHLAGAPSTNSPNAIRRTGPC